MLAVGVIAFALFRYVGDPVVFMLGQDATPEDRQRMTEALDLDKPFTLQYAREQVDEELWDNLGFYRINLVISWGWFIAFLGMTVSSALLGMFEEKETLLNWIIPNLFMVAAIKFTDWYPKHMEARAAVPG